MRARGSTVLAPWGCSVMLCTSRWTLPATPSAQISTRLMPWRDFLVGHTEGSAVQSLVCSPVAGLHMSLNAVRGTLIVVKSLPAGTENLALKHPREKGIEPPPAHEYDGAIVPAAKETRKPL